MLLYVPSYRAEEQTLRKYYSYVSNIPRIGNKRGTYKEHIAPINNYVRTVISQLYRIDRVSRYHQCLREHEQYYPNYNPTICSSDLNPAHSSRDINRGVGGATSTLPLSNAIEKSSIWVGC